MNISEGDDVIVTGYYKDSELWVNYWWNCTNGKGHLPKVRILWPSMLVTCVLLIGLVGMIIWRPEFIYSPASGLGLIAFFICLSLVQAHLAEQKAAVLIDAARRN